MPEVKANDRNEFNFLRDSALASGRQLIPDSDQNSLWVPVIISLGFRLEFIFLKG